MAFYHRNSERKRMHHDYRRQEEEVVGSLCRLGSRPVSPNSLLEQDKRIRREIANSNERRRMQSINAGFESLRSLLPQQECEKLSKAGILHSTADYVYQLEQEKERLQQHNNQLSKRMQSSARINHDGDGSCFDSPKPKRKKCHLADCVDEEIGSFSPSRSENGIDDAKREVLVLRLQLKRERTLRLLLEEQIRNFESRRYPAGAGLDSEEQIRGVTDEKNKLPKIMDHESGFRSPRPLISSQDVQSLQEISLQESTPDLSSIKNPAELSGENKPVSLQCVNDLSLYDVTTTPGLLKSPNHLNVSSPFPDEININQHQAASYKVSTSRQNLETIVEAIRHVEGDYLFQDDTTVSEETVGIREDKLSVTEQQTKQVEQPALSTSQDFAFQHQKIKNAPLAQSRPGVIVSNMP